MIAAALVLHWASTYQPLVMGSVSQQPPGSEVTDVDEALHLRWVPGSEQHVLVSVRNSGQRTIRIDGTTYDRPAVNPLWLTTTRWSADRIPGTGTVFHPFPATVKPGAELLVQLTFVQRSCGWQANTGFGFASLQVRTSVLGRAHDWTVKTGFAEIEATAPKVVPAALTVPCDPG